MKRRIRVKPGREESLLSVFVGIVMCIVGILLLPQFGWFGLLWLAVAAAITVLNAINAFGKKGITSRIIEVEDGESGKTDDGQGSCSASEIRKRLGVLDELLADGSITKEEYAKKRSEILQKL